MEASAGPWTNKETGNDSTQARHGFGHGLGSPDSAQRNGRMAAKPLQEITGRDAVRRVAYEAPACAHGDCDGE